MGHMATRDRHSVAAAPLMLGAVETKDADGAGATSAPTEAEIKKLIEDVMTGFEEFKKTNDERLSEIEKKGGADPLLEEKLQKMEKDIDKGEDLHKRVTAVEAQKEAIKSLEEAFDELSTAVKRAPTAQSAEQKAEQLKETVNTWGRGVIDAFTRGVANLDADQQKAIEAATQEYKALRVATDTSGGYLAPIDYVREIIKEITEISPARSLARVRPTGMKSVSQPKRTGRGSARRTTEQGQRTETDNMSWGNIEIPAPEAYAMLDISEQNLEDSFWDLEAELREEATEQFAVLEGYEFVMGSGTNEAEGFLTNSDVAETLSGAAADITADGLITLQHDIKTGYARNARFTLNRRSLGGVRRLKHTDGTYVWIPGIANGSPNTILGDPYVEVPDMPDIGAGTTPIAYGDFRRAYTLVDRLLMSLLRDPYTQATAGNIRFLFRRRFGGQVTLAEAIRKLKVGS